MTYLHGVETNRTKSGPTPVPGAETAIIGLIGTAPIFEVDAANRTVNVPVLVNNENEGVKMFGSDREGYTIPHALKAIFAQGGAIVHVINVFDPSEHKASVSSSKQFANGKIPLTQLGIANLVVTKSTTPAVLGTDYTFENNVITRISGSTVLTSATDTVTVAYDYADITKVLAADVIGGVDTDEVKTGIAKFKDCKALFGTKPKILIAPVFIETNTVRSALEVVANNLKAVYYADAPSGTTKAAAIAGRGSNGTINFNTQNQRAMLAFPHVKAYNANEDVTAVKPLSPYMAGLRAYVDKTEGVHVSTSNHKIYGIEGVEAPIGFELTDPDCDSNLLNAQGITTVINCGEYRLWGNRNAMFPSSADVDTFECVLRTADYIDESIENATMQYMDKPINNALIDRIVNMGQNFLNDEQGKGTIISGKVWYDLSKNSATEITKGHIVLSRKFVSPAPNEKVSYQSDIDINLYKSIGGTS